LLNEYLNTHPQLEIEYLSMKKMGVYMLL